VRSSRQITIDNTLDERLRLLEDEVCLTLCMRHPSCLKCVLDAARDSERLNENRKFQGTIFMVPLYASTPEGIRAHFNIQTSILGGTDDPSRLLLLESITSLTHRGVCIFLLVNIQVIDSYPSDGIMNKNQSVTTSNWPGNPSTNLQCLRRKNKRMSSKWTIPFVSYLAEQSPHR
jgi:hypothetical protein